jgi:hypothetical protein
MELILGIIIFVLCIVILMLNLFYKTEKENAMYYRDEYIRIQNENYELMREVYKMDFT